MAYVIVGILVLLLAGGLITYVVMQAAKRKSGAAPSDEAAGDRDDTEAPGVGPDASPLGDTTEHAGGSNASGESVGAQDAEGAGGTGAPIAGDDSVEPSGEPAAPGPDRRFQRDPIGGEGEARPFTE